MKQPFSYKDLNEIFKVSSTNENIVISRESNTLEFKESFSSDVFNRCLKTIAGFANNEGGYIVFGIKDSPHLLQGLNEKSLKRFDELDPAKISESLNNHFAPEIKWKMIKYGYRDKQYGIMYIYQAFSKPVICIKTEGDNIRESAIYYRYRGQSREIKYPELKAIIELEKEKIHTQWMKTIKQIGDTGISKTALLDLKSGKMTGPNTTLYMDESLLEEISFVQEGSFVETGGDPALVVKGQIQTVVGAQKIIVEKDKARAINSDGIIKSFIMQEKVDSPQEYIKQISYQTTGNLPIYFYMNLSSLSVEQTLELLKEVPVNSQQKELLKRRLENKETKYIPISSQSSKAAKQKRYYHQNILENKLNIPNDIVELKYCIIAIRGLRKDDIVKNKDYILNVIYKIYTDYFNTQKYESIKNEFRYMICWIDEALFMN